MKEKEVILHCHLFKNAGTTLDWALQRTFSDGFIDHRDDSKMREEGVAYLDGYLSEKPEVRALSSHHIPFMPEHKKPYQWLVLLREPISRARSVYEFEVRQPESSLGSKMAKRMGFSEYIKWRMQDDVQPVIKDFYVRYLCNKAVPGSRVNDSDFEHVAQRLSLKNVLVGTVERFDESIVVFEESLRMSFPDIDLSYVRQNVGSYKTDFPRSFLGEITPESKVLLIENNRLDKKLHEVFSENQEKTIAGIHGFNDKLKEFRARCLALSLDVTG